MLHYAWLSRCATSYPRLAAPVTITFKRKRSNALDMWCEAQAEGRQQALASLHLARAG
jgi:hypothetical protein